MLVFFQVVQVLLPFYGKQVLFFIVAILAGRYAVAPCALTPAGKRYDVIKGQLLGWDLCPAVIALARSNAAFPPLTLAQLASLVPFPADLFF
jgi:hypothetical protein